MLLMQSRQSAGDKFLRVPIDVSFPKTLQIHRLLERVLPLRSLFLTRRRPVLGQRRSTRGKKENPGQPKNQPLLLFHKRIDDARAKYALVAIRSVVVVINGPVAVAGSIPIRWKINGSTAPIVAATVMEITMPNDTTTAK